MHNLFRIKLSQHMLHFIVAALLLAYAGLFQHQAEHFAGGESDCAECLVASHLGHALPSTPAALSVPAEAELPPAVAIAGFTSAPIRFFSARAPPSFL